jgi:hypothetical protein
VDGYTKRNIKTEVDDLAPKFGMSPNLDYRVARDVLGTEQTAISYLRMAPDYRFPSGTSTNNKRRSTSSFRAARASSSTTTRSSSCRGTPSVSPRRPCAISKPAPDGAELILFGAPRTDAGDAEMHQR